MMPGPLPKKGCKSRCSASEAGAEREDFRHIPA